MRGVTRVRTQLHALTAFMSPSINNTRRRSSMIAIFAQNGILAGSESGLVVEDVRDDERPPTRARTDAWAAPATYVLLLTCVSVC